MCSLTRLLPLISAALVNKVTQSDERRISDTLGYTQYFHANDCACDDANQEQ